MFPNFLRIETTTRCCVYGWQYLNNINCSTKASVYLDLTNERDTEQFWMAKEIKTKRSKTKQKQHYNNKQNEERKKNKVCIDALQTAASIQSIRDTCIKLYERTRRHLNTTNVVFSYFMVCLLCVCSVDALFCCSFIFSHTFSAYIKNHHSTDIHENDLLVFYFYDYFFAAFLFSIYSHTHTSHRARRHHLFIYDVVYRKHQRICGMIPSLSSSLSIRGYRYIAFVYICQLQRSTWWTVVACFLSFRFIQQISQHIRIFSMPHTLPLILRLGCTLSVGPVECTKSMCIYRGKTVKSVVKRG